MRYMPYTTHHVYSLLKIENAAFLTYLWYTYSIIAHDTRQLQSRIALILTNNMSTIVIMSFMTVFQLGNAYIHVALPSISEWTKNNQRLYTCIAWHYQCVPTFAHQFHDLSKFMSSDSSCKQWIFTNVPHYRRHRQWHHYTYLAVAVWIFTEIIRFIPY